MLSGVGVQCGKGWTPPGLPPPGAKAQASCGQLTAACWTPTRRICLLPQCSCRTLSPKHLGKQAFKSLGLRAVCTPPSHAYSPAQPSPAQPSTAQHSTAQHSAAQHSAAQDGMVTITTEHTWCQLHAATCPNIHNTHKLVGRGAVPSTTTSKYAQPCHTAQKAGMGLAKQRLRMCWQSSQTTDDSQ